MLFIDTKLSDQILWNSLDNVVHRCVIVLSHFVQETIISYLCLVGLNVGIMELTTLTITVSITQYNVQVFFKAE